MANKLKNKKPVVKSSRKPMPEDVEKMVANEASA